MTLTDGDRPSGPDPVAAWKTRAAWHRRTALLPIGYLTAAAVTAPLAARGVLTTWLVLHLMFLGAVTNAIIVWSTHFAAAILRAPASERRSGEALRLIALNIGIAIVLAGGSAALPWLGVVGASLVFGAVAAHLMVLTSLARRALPARFMIVVQYYLAAGLALLTGIPAGAWMLTVPDDRRPRVLVFHAQVNVLGWITLTVLGTLLTLWPTVLRTRIPDGAERAARRGFWWCCSGLTILALGICLWVGPVMAAGLAIFTTGVLIVLWPAMAAYRQRPSAMFAPLALAAGTGWLLITIGWDSWVLLSASDPAFAASRFDLMSVAIAAGYAAQIVAGALAYLLPMALGGGSTSVLSNSNRLSRLGWQRVLAANIGLVAALLPGPEALRLAGIVLLAIVWAWFLLSVASVAILKRR